MLENWKLSGIQLCVVVGPANNRPLSPWMVVEKDARQLAGGVNVVVNEPTDMLRESAFSRAFNNGTWCLIVGADARKVACCIADRIVLGNPN